MQADACVTGADLGLAKQVHLIQRILRLPTSRKLVGFYPTTISYQLNNSTMKTQTFAPIQVNMELKGAVEGILSNYGKKVVQLTQEVRTITTYEPREGNSRADGLEGISAKVGGAEYDSTSTRTSLFAIADGVTAEQVQAALAAKPDSMLYQVISSDVVTTAEQSYQIFKGVLSKDTLAESQIVRPKGGGDPVLNDEGNFIFRACFFSATKREDEDESDMAAVYTPAAYAHLKAPSLPIVQSTAGEAAAEAAREQGAPVAALVDNGDSL